MGQIVECSVQDSVSLHLFALLWIWSVGDLISFFVFLFELLFGLDAGKFNFCQLGTFRVDSRVEFENLLLLKFLVQQFFNHLLVFEFPTFQIKMVVHCNLIPPFLFRLGPTIRFQMATALDSRYLFVFTIVERPVPRLVGVYSLIFVNFVTPEVLFRFNFSPFNIAQLIQLLHYVRFPQGFRSFSILIPFGIVT